MLALVIGGSGSGKSEYAEKLVCSLRSRRVYLATMRSGDPESSERIERHRSMRAGKGFVTVEKETDAGEAGPFPDSAVLLEDMGNLLANEVYRRNGIAAAEAADKILRDISVLYDGCGDLVIVSNDVFSGGLLYDNETKEYMMGLAYINREIAKRADLVAEVVCGIPDLLKEPG